MFQWRFSIWSIIAVFGHQTTCQFFNPPDNSSVPIACLPSYSVGQSITIKWASPSQFNSIVLWDTDPSSPYTILAPTNVTSYEWVVSYESLNSTQSKTFYLALYPGGSYDPDFVTVNFYITNPNSTITSASLPSAATATVTITTTITPTVTPSTHSCAGWSGGAVAGVAIGSALGTLGLASLVLLWVWKPRLGKWTSVAMKAEPTKSTPAVGTRMSYHTESPGVYHDGDDITTPHELQ